MLEKIAHDLWVARAAILPLSTVATMTIVRQRSGNLVVISPISVNTSLVAEIKALGNVTTVISPNAFHHLFFHQFLAQFPDATYYYAPTLAKKIRKRLVSPSRALPLSMDITDPWAQEVIPIHIRWHASRLMNLFFYHQASKNAHRLRFLVFYSKILEGLMAKLFWKMAGVSPVAPSQSRFFKF